MESSLLKKWNANLYPREPSKKFIELVLGKNPLQDMRTIRSEWYDANFNSKESIIRECLGNLYRVKTACDREILCYFVKDSDTWEFESDMKSAWGFLEECYDDEEWWRECCIKQFGKFSKGYLTHGLSLEKSTTIISGIRKIDTSLVEERAVYK